MSEENRGTHKLYEKDRIGEVQIADEVVAIIAGLAATEVEGVDSMAGNITNELVGKLGMKNLSKGVKVDVTENHVSVDLSLNIRYGFNIPSVSEQVQEQNRERKMYSRAQAFRTSRRYDQKRIKRTLF